jgi:hypothetical protein
MSKLTQDGENSGVSRDVPEERGLSEPVAA